MPSQNPPIQLRLVRKLAEEIDGVSLAEYRIGDVIQVPRSQARLLIAEGWAIVASARDDDGPPAD
jgi:hypothetical protein